MATLNTTEKEYFSQKPFNLELFLGQWYIVQTSLGFWQNRFNPTVTYTAEPGRVLDEVRYLNQQGQTQIIVGYDTVRQGALFQWVGKPWYMRFLRSYWGVVAHDELYQQWAVTYFSATIFTPAGMDIYSRTAILPPELVTHIFNQINTLSFLQTFIPHLYQTHTQL